MTTGTPEVTPEDRDAAESLALRICSCATTPQHRAAAAAVLAFAEEVRIATTADLQARLEAAEGLELVLREALGLMLEAFEDEGMFDGGAMACDKARLALLATRP